jgi:low affinity Fe/Cu permease
MVYSVKMALCNKLCNRFYREIHTLIYQQHIIVAVIVFLCVFFLTNHKAFKINAITCKPDKQMMHRLG